MLPSLEPTAAISQKIKITRRVVTQPRRGLRKDLMAVGIVGSIARGTAETYSDIDLVIMIKRIRHDVRHVLAYMRSRRINTDPFDAAVIEWAIARIRGRMPRRSHDMSR